MLTSRCCWGGLAGGQGRPVPLILRQLPWCSLTAEHNGHSNDLVTCLHLLVKRQAEYVRTGGGSGRVYGSSIGTLVFLNKCNVFLDASQRGYVI